MTISPKPARRAELTLRGVLIGILITFVFTAALSLIHISEPTRPY